MNAQNDDTSSNNSNDLAETRTDWAEDRTLLANERTFAGWMRTGMACVALALGLKAVFKDLDRTWLAQSVATIFIALAIFIFWSARQRAAKTQGRLSQHDTRSQSTARMTFMATFLSVGAALTGAILWLL